MLHSILAIGHVLYLLDTAGFCGVQGMELIKRQIDLPLTFPIGLPLFILPSPDYLVGNETTVWSRNSDEANNIILNETVFEINETQLVLAQLLSNSKSSKTGRQYEVLLNSTKAYFPSYLLRVRVVKSSASLCSPGPKMCFLTPTKLKYFIPDSLPAGQTFDVISNPILENVCQRNLQVTYSVSNGSHLIDIDNKSGALSVRETVKPSNDYYRINIGCSIKAEDQEMLFTFEADVRFYDVNNHAPYMFPGKSPYVDIEISSLKVGVSISDPFNVYDNDSPQVNGFTPHLENDYLGFFTVKVKRTAVGDDGTFVMISELTPVKEVTFPEKLYEFQMVFEDKNMERQLQNEKVVFHIRIHNRTKEALPEIGDTFYATLSRSASKYARVGNVSFSSLHKSGTKFDILSLNCFAITPKTGIIFVKDQATLRNISENPFLINVTWFNPQGAGYYVISVSIIDKSEYCSNEDYVASCGVHGVGPQCLSSCGEGSSDGRCEWRPSVGNLNLSARGYATCSPSLRTCPDGECDELETKHKKICPQDCAKEIRGQARGRPDGGIESGRGTCTCFVPDNCACGPHTEGIPAKRKSGPQIGNRATESSTNNDVHVQMKGPVEMCGQKCIVVILSVFLTLVLTGCLLCVMYHCRGRPRRRKEHHFNSHISLSVVPSDYVDERRVSAAGQVISASLLQASLLHHADNAGSRKNSVDVKWEFAREKLILEQVLGEGEFGRVVKGRAKGIKDRPGYTVVAVKMLKECSSPSDRDDLLSELNLLKEVNHPNVIQLLGACTQKDGPLYVIVEYAELGSLRCLLRQCRRLDFERMEQLGTVENPAYLTEATVLKQRDLLQFAWQTAKGMAYLSDIKVVHRDLATRNILLGSGKVVKISDFGLSRDVYEGDTYLKKSKGRVPVKWMALESLQDHVYTTKSDVWSFGVVLWEIVNLGASPYPGVTPERLYQLLKMGYRMEKPENCSEEVYSVMRQCWRASPSQRPSFKSLSQKLDALLQDTAVYLDLDITVTCGHEDSYMDNESCEEEVFTPLTYSCIAEETQLEYGNICHILSGSSGSSVQDI